MLRNLTVAAWPNNLGYDISDSAGHLVCFLYADPSTTRVFVNELGSNGEITRFLVCPRRDEATPLIYFEQCQMMGIDLQEAGYGPRRQSG